MRLHTPTTFKPDFSKLRGDRFSYTCNACSRCCREKIIRLSPYEVARLASRFRIGTTIFIKAYTCAEGAVLRFPPSGVCVFLDREGCSVHSDRPLVCRLYPLGRNTSDEKGETFSLLESEAGCVGTHGDGGTLADYLSEQEAGEYIEAADRYLALFEGLLNALRRTIPRNGMKSEDMAEMMRPPSVSGKASVPGWLDMDLVLSDYCSDLGVALPESLHERMLLHIEAVEKLLAGAHRETWTLPDMAPKRAGMPSPEKPLSSLDSLRRLARMAAVLGYSLGVNMEEVSL